MNSVFLRVPLFSDNLDVQTRIRLCETGKEQGWREAGAACPETPAPRIIQAPLHRCRDLTIIQFSVDHHLKGARFLSSCLSLF